MRIPSRWSRAGGDSDKVVEKTALPSGLLVVMKRCICRGLVPSVVAMLMLLVLISL